MHKSSSEDSSDEETMEFPDAFDAFQPNGVLNEVEKNLSDNNPMDLNSNDIWSLIPAEPSSSQPNVDKIEYIRNLDVS